MGNYWYSDLFECDVKKECEEKAEKRVKEYKIDPNNYPYEYSIEYKKKVEHIPPKVKIWKRRQVTANGDPEPKNPCDDNGLPVTNDDGTIKWGPWVEGSEKVTTDDIKNVPSGQECKRKLNELYWGNLISKPDAQTKIITDQLLHDEQQERRKNKIHVEYKIEDVKPEEDRKYWTAKIDREKVREFPNDWVGAKFNLSENAEPYKKYIGNTMYINEPIYISLDRVGTFKGRKRFTTELKGQEVFSKVMLKKNLPYSGFIEMPSRSYHYRDRYYLPVPYSEDACVLDIRDFSSYYRRNLKFKASYDAKNKLFGNSGYLSPSDAFALPEFTVQKIIDAPPTVFNRTNFIEYEEKAPLKTMQYCYDKFIDVTRNSMVLLEEEKKD